MKTLTSEEYIWSGIKVCPICGSYNIDSTNEPDEIDDVTSILQHEMECYTCSSTWLEKYQLIGYMKGERNECSNSVRCI